MHKIKKCAKSGKNTLKKCAISGKNVIQNMHLVAKILTIIEKNVNI